jgi:FKBP-type peptidyl-prolyl cis-trans isomerase 2
MITDLDENNITLDANHPLAGSRVILDIELVEIV